MNTPNQDKLDPSDDTGVADVRIVRDKIASLYNGDLRKHALDTDRIVQPLIDQLGLKEGTPARHDDRRSGTAG